jgi:hypothetical protein
MADVDDELYRKIARFQNDVINAWGDTQDLEREAATWPDADEIAARANEAVSALDALNDAINDYLPES